jgi:hypothetical protein
MVTSVPAAVTLAAEIKLSLPCQNVLSLTECHDDLRSIDNSGLSRRTEIKRLFRTLANNFIDVPGTPEYRLGNISLPGYSGGRYIISSPFRTAAAPDFWTAG